LILFERKQLIFEKSLARLQGSLGHPRRWRRLNAPECLKNVKRMDLDINSRNEKRLSGASFSLFLCFQQLGSSGGFFSFL